MTNERLGGHSAFQGILKMLNLTSPTVTPAAEEEAVADVDEPPDNLSPPPSQSKILSQLPDRRFIKSPRIPMDRKESLLTMALLNTPESQAANSSRQPPVARNMSTTSVHSNASVSTVDLSSGATSPARSSSPSPPLPPQYHDRIPSPQHLKLRSDTEVPHVPLTPVTEAPEAKVEANLGRKRCITFACRPKEPTKPVETPKVEPVAQPPKRKCALTFACPTQATKPVEAPKVEVPAAAEPPKRKCALTFACPTRKDSSDNTKGPDPEKRPQATRASTPPLQTAKPVEDESEGKTKDQKFEETPRRSVLKVENSGSEATAFHEFASSHSEEDAWINEALENKPKITMDDLMKKEMAIRQMGQQAEEEAEEEEREAEELDEELEDPDQEDDFAPSDDDLSSTGGNESDNEEGFAESDDDSEAGSDDIFWARSTTTAATSMEALDQLHHFTSRRTSASSVESLDSAEAGQHRHPVRHHYKRRSSKVMKMRPGTPDLPDSTDFVCGTLDEDRPLEAAYISCMEQRRRAKHVVIPQDIDPSFPTTDPEDELDEEDEVDDDEDDEPQWLKGQFDEVSNETYRGRHRKGVGRRSPSPRRAKSPAPAKKRVHSPAPVKKRVHSPAPVKRVHSPAPRQKNNRSPPPRRLFGGQSPRRFHSPPPGIKLTSPPGTRRTSVNATPQGHTPVAVGITITRLAQRPNTSHTASLPHTPNPYFRNYNPKRGEEPEEIVASITPTGDNRAHVRGAVDIVIGLEKKRQKRKEKFWRQHCRKAAKEQAERKPAPGKGAERMKELGLECAERSRGYGLANQGQHVLSL